MKLLSPDYAILYIDDEERSLKYFDAIFDEVAPILTATGPEEGYRLFVENHDRIGLVLSDNKMPNESGLELLTRIRDFDPRPLRFLVTAYADLSVAVDSLNNGLLYSYLSKPWDPDDLEHRLVKALTHFCLEREREILIAEKTEALNQLVMADKIAGIGILSTGLNHHLRNSLTVLRTFYDMLPYQLEEELGGGPKDASFWNEYYNEVGGQIERMTAILTNLADGAGNGAIQSCGPVDLGTVAESSAELVFDEIDGIKFSLNRQGKIPTISGDIQKLAQMMRLLFQEAKAGIRGPGEVEVLLSPCLDRKGVKMHIVDSGEPIPEQDMKHLFDPFFVRSNKPEELGTNLLACYLTVFHHGGSITAMRSPEGRNQVEVVLPLMTPSATGAGNLPISQRYQASFDDTPSLLR